MLSTSHLARRGLEIAHEALSKPKDDQPKHVSLLQLIIFLITMAMFTLILVAFSYTYAHLIPTLCMIESPETEAYVPVGSLDPNEPPAYSAVPKPDDEEETEVDDVADEGLIRNKPITASIRKTIQHLKAKAGFWSRFRGLSMFLVWHFVNGIIVSVLSAIFRARIGVAIAAIIAETVLAQLHMAWVHIVISEPSPKKFYQRIPPMKTWVKIAPAVALWALCSQLVSILPLLVTGSFGSMKHMKDPEFEPGRKDLYAIGAQGFFAFFLMLLLFVLLQIPATVTLTRVAASMLPEEDETIVPFDRTFGGKTTPAIIGGQGKIGLVEAWRSFPWASRVRLLKLVAKITVIAMAIWIFFTVIMVVEAHVLFGDQLGEMMKTIHGIAGPK